MPPCNHLEGKRVLITGAGGSIGLELAKQAQKCNPNRLFLMDHSEEALARLVFMSCWRRPDFILHNIINHSRTNEQFRELKPDIVFHAAAYKHVPLLEFNEAAAHENNTLGTVSVTDACIDVGARLVMISTDKAVNPASVMGRTKRLAELYILSREDAQHSIVRFGNVLGSSGSVLKLWESQLDERGYIEVTDPRMTRYFMTIPEAASLVIAVASIPQAAPTIYALDMGEPVAIGELARRFLAEHGVDESHIKITGSRPGEKMHEELAYDSEQLEPSGVAGVWRLFRN